ncbi:hypothetical protein VSR34_07450 [Paraburkholderia sp. JHI2823]|uniref:hypothetical protein n=1 Tax=Paraburkholderia TaxID=1822464 RepID=UPI000482844B|nr:hypothetical protein [Paraburkholderia mimosarum]
MNHRVVGVTCKGRLRPCPLHLPTIAISHAKNFGLLFNLCVPYCGYTDEWNVPGTTTIVRAMPDDTVMDMKLDERGAVI